MCSICTECMYFSDSPSLVVVPIYTPTSNICKPLIPCALAVECYLPFKLLHNVSVFQLVTHFLSFTFYFALYIFNVHL